MRRRAIPILVVLVLVLAAGRGLGLPGSSGDSGTGDSGRTTTASATSREARVLRVVDGDTIKVSVDGRTERVRYIGIDTPETVKPNSPVECYGKSASDRNRALVGGESVRLERDVRERDRYDRLLAYVFRVRDGLFVNADLVAGGYASPLRITPDVRYATRFRKLADEARSHRRGLWGACAGEAIKRRGEG
jgi:micrococcal nuclease